MPNMAEPSRETLESEYASTFSINVIKRIIRMLGQNGRLKRTNLAGMSGLNYNKCIRYLNLLHALGWVRVVFENGSCFVTATAKGLEDMEKLANFR